MELGPNNLEQLFKSGFEGYSPEVDPKVWNNIQRSINKPGNGSGSFFGSLAGKLLLGTAAVTVIAVTTILLVNSNNNTPSSNPKTTAYISPSNTNHTSSNTVPVPNPGPKTNPVNNNNNTPVAPHDQPLVHKKDAVKPDQNSGNSNTNNNNGGVTNNNQGSSTKTDLNKPDDHGNGNNNQNITNQNNGQNQNTKKDDPTVTNNNQQDPESQNNNTGTKSPLAKISFSASAAADGKVYAPVAVTFLNKYKAYTQEWTFGDGTFSSVELSPVHIFENPGEYTITLTATNEQGHIEKDSIKIRILVNAFFIPNTFTPNGDGNNDVYKVIKNEKFPYELSHVEVVIYDRTNQKVGAFTDGGSWDGHNFKNGEMCPQGTYLILVKYMSSEDGKSHEQVGSLFLRE